ncbi:hypothetical protein [Microcoleus sp. N3A4]|uniref:hypothetical protein n=1 Tax=Microcoleus sp. N3A4 TaxID=3055379 RepID=UPI002FD66102
MTFWVKFYAEPALCFLANFDFLTADARKLAMTTLTVEILCSEAAIFSAAESQHPEPLLYGITDGRLLGHIWSKSSDSISSSNMNL